MRKNCIFRPHCVLQALDVDKSGTVTLDELREGLAKQGSPITQKEVEALMESIDVDATGSIDYDEFLAATMNMSQLQARSPQQPHHWTALDSSRALNELKGLMEYLDVEATGPIKDGAFLAVTVNISQLQACSCCSPIHPEAH